MATAQVGPIEMYYEEHGSGDPLLLVMGFAVDSQGWLLQTPAFAEHYRTIVFDNRGVGRSSKPAGPYSTAEMADDAAGLLDHLGIERAHVVGISMGGMIAQQLALAHADRVRGLVLACTYAEPSAGVLDVRDTSLAELGGAVAADGKIELAESGFDPLALFQTLMPLVFNPSFLQQNASQMLELFSGALQWGFSVEGIVAQMQACMQHCTTDRLGRIQAPTLVITGDADKLIPATSSRQIAAGIPNAKLVELAGGSHAFNFEAPDFFNGQVLEFLASAIA